MLISEMLGRRYIKLSVNEFVTGFSPGDKSLLKFLLALIYVDEYVSFISTITSILQLFFFLSNRR